MGKNKKSKIIWASITVAWAIFIWMNSLNPGTKSLALSNSVLQFVQTAVEWLGIRATVTSVFIRKAAHFTEYFVLGVFIYQCLKALYTKNSKMQKWFLFIVPVFVACVDEGIQYFVPGRSAQLFDVLLDMAGAFLAIVVFLWGARLRAKSKIRTEQ